MSEPAWHDSSARRDKHSTICYQHPRLVQQGARTSPLALVWRCQ